MTTLPNQLDPCHAAAYLKNASDALCRVIPELEGDTRSVVEEVTRTLIRTSLHLSPGFYGLDMEPESPPCEFLNRLEGKAAELLHLEPPGEGEVQGRSFDREKILHYLHQHPRGGANLTISHAKLLAGGRSKQTVLLEVKDAIDLPSQLVLRRDWVSSVTGTSVVSEFELLSAVHQRGLKVPEPLLLEKDPEALGSPFIIMRRVDGKALGDPFTPPASEKPVLDVARELAKLHSFNPDEFMGLEGVEERYLTEAQLKEQLTAYRATIGQLGGETPIINEAFDWLESKLPDIRHYRTLCHHDMGFHNMLCNDNGLCAILDWELAHIGNPGFDLGYLRSIVSQCVDWDTFLETYHSAGGIVESRETIDFFTLFASVWLYQLLIQARAAIASGMLQDLEVTHVSAHFLPALQARIANELALVTRTGNGQKEDTQ